MVSRLLTSRLYFPILESMSFDETMPWIDPRLSRLMVHYMVYLSIPTSSPVLCVMFLFYNTEVDSLTACVHVIIYYSASSARESRTANRLLPPIMFCFAIERAGKIQTSYFI